MLGNHVSSSRWNMGVIGCDHKPGLPRCGMSSEIFESDPDERVARSIPYHVRRMIETGEGFSFALPPPDPCGFPGRAYFAADDKEVEETRKTCATPHCKNTLSIKARRDHCHTCCQTIAAKKVREKHHKMTGIDKKEVKRVHDAKASG